MNKSGSLFCIIILLSFLTACNQMTPAARLQYNDDGKFKIVQITDTHVIPGNSGSEITLKNLEAVLEMEKPDFVIHTGDIVYGKPAAKAAHLVFDILAGKGIPFAVTLGNHDGEFDLNRQQLLDLISGMDGCVNKAKNNILTLSGQNGLDRVFYLFDSGNRDDVADINSWGYIHEDQIDWYRKASDYYTKHNGGEPVPSVAFFHIPLPEINDALKETAKQPGFYSGNQGEAPCSPLFNSGLYLAMRERGDVQAISTGHDHNNDFVVYWQDFFFMYGRYGSFDNIYNDLQPSGARVFEFTDGQPGFRTWIRLADGRKEQEFYLYPGMGSLAQPR